MQPGCGAGADPVKVWLRSSVRRRHRRGNDRGDVAGRGEQRVDPPGGGRELVRGAGQLRRHRGRAGVVRALAEACRRADDDPREQQPIRDIADLLEAEETLCAEAGTGEAHWRLAQLLDDLGHIGEAVIWYRHAADDGDSRAADKLAGPRARQNPYADTADDQPKPPAATFTSYARAADSTPSATLRLPWECSRQSGAGSQS